VRINQRDLALVAIGAAIASTVIMLWPTSTYDQCMIDKIQGQEPIDSTVIETAREACKSLPRKGDQ
jgi:hypothetical protein